MDGHFPASHYHFEDGLYVSEGAKTEIQDFETAYLKVRDKEKRILSPEQIRALPNVNAGASDEQLWNVRRKNLSRFFSYLSKKPSQQNILDIGCGNGFFSHRMSELGHRVCAVDINLYELKQAVEAFPESSVHWLYANVDTDFFPKGHFDLITFCCSFQYFKNPSALLARCFELLSPQGEIHIIDSPFYKAGAAQAAKLRTASYYKSLDVPEMADYYFHHPFSVVDFPFTVKMYRPNALKTKLFGDSPFYWLKLNP